MMFRCHQRWVLWRMDHRLRRSDPHLAAMLAIFAKLYAGEAIPGRRPAGWLGGLVLRLLARSGETVAKAAARQRDCARWILRAITAGWRLSRTPPTAPNRSPASRHSGAQGDL